MSKVEKQEEEVKDAPIDPRFDEWTIGRGGGLKAKGAGKWMTRLRELKDEYGEDNEQVYVLSMLPIRPDQKIEMSKEFFK
jgi:hypothetical protein